MKNNKKLIRTVMNKNIKVVSIDKINNEINKLKNNKLQGENGDLKIFSKDENRKFVVDTLSNKVNLAIAQYLVQKHSLVHQV